MTPRDSVRQVNAKGRTNTRFACYGNLPVVLRYNSVRLRQAEPRAFARLLGREERLEDVCQVLRRNSSARVLHRQAQPVAFPHARHRWAFDRGDEELLMDAQLATVRHCIAWVTARFITSCCRRVGSPMTIYSPGAQ